MILTSALFTHLSAFNSFFFFWFWGGGGGVRLGGGLYATLVSLMLSMAFGAVCLDHAVLGLA